MTVHTMRHTFSGPDTPNENRMFSVAEALELGVGTAEVMAKLPTESVVLEMAAGRILAEPVSNHEPLPRYSGAVMDGFAIRRGDLVGPGPWVLRVDGHLNAGHKKSERPVCGPGGALSVNTGAQIFGTLDAVVPHELAETDGRTVTIFQCPARNANIRSRGQDAKVGTGLLPAGRVLTARDIALLAGMGRAEITVRQRLRVACLSTGSELIEVGIKPGRGQIHDSNRPMMKASLNREWITYLDLGVIRDDIHAVKNALPVAAGVADVIIVTGGASGGIQTTMTAAMEQLGGDTIVRNVAMKPGRPLMITTLNGTLCLCLPGNPVSATIVMETLGWEILRRRASVSGCVARHEKGIAGFKMTGRPGRAEFPLANIIEAQADGTPVLALSPGANSGNLRRLSEADGFIHISADHEDIRHGTPLTFTRL